MLNRISEGDSDILSGEEDPQAVMEEEDDVDNSEEEALTEEEQETVTEERVRRPLGAKAST